MPWYIDENDCVIKGKKGESGEQVKCHDSHDKAVAHLRALYKSESGKPHMKSDADLIACMESDDPFAEDATDEVVEETIIASPDETILVPTVISTDTTNSANATIVIAHAEPTAPPSTFFTEPPSEFQRRYTTITDDGRVMGLLATFDECHVGYGEMCITAPREADYSHFAVGTVLTSDGTSIPTGVISIQGGHADVGLDASSARAHYDNPASGLVDVAVGTSDIGIWFSGALRPDATPEQIRQLRASGVSGDWRLIDGELRLIGICSVNVPGFPKLSVAASAEGLTSLIAAGGEPLPHPDLCACKDSTQDIIEELDNLQRLVADAGLEDVALAKLAERIPPDDTELDSLYSRVT